MAYRLIVFDCINTLLLPDYSQIPKITVNGGEVHSTAPYLLPHLLPLVPELKVEAVHQALRDAWMWAEAQRKEDFREVPGHKRFNYILKQLGVKDSDPQLGKNLLQVHMDAVVGCFTLPPAHLALLQALQGKYRLALLSNFDHTDSLQSKLEECGIAEFFDPLIISEALGHRKPGAKAFTHTLTQGGSEAKESLMVGDSHGDDVIGALTAGMDVAWLNPKGEAPPDPQPTYTISTLAELPTLL